MKISILIMLITFSPQINAQPKWIDLDIVRTNYGKAVSDKKLCMLMIKQLHTVKSNPIYLGYLGGFQTIRAKHVFNPLKKLSTFKEGKKNLELAITQEPQSADLKFIRLSIQKNTPSFLGYSNQMETDIIFIKIHKKQISSNIVLLNIDNLMDHKS
ncbi:hypothetical protein KO02_17315 [Sphingobacterium sp. ML3W]|uniref:hypothetical protein n=1 Tax=Sphingobacterium sp. ML3W TaxID=1538644 RepID=UPI0004F5B1EB|nr:hypothetical protein [Sphingobacterium sp. ML3W]AIM38246.1 hypothetical protein KO02_17315 [Sphingobacterium sp. ML3W]